MNPFSYVCGQGEDFRIEIRGKSTLVGFFGIAPNVEITIQPNAEDIERLTFVLLTGRAARGSWKITTDLVDDHGKVIKHGKETGLTVVSDFRLNIASTFTKAPISKAGRYTFRLAVDGRTFYKPPSPSSRVHRKTSKLNPLQSPPPQSEAPGRQPVSSSA